jgi:hypothetical protein
LRNWPRLGLPDYVNCFLFSLASSAFVHVEGLAWRIEFDGLLFRIIVEYCGRNCFAGLGLVAEGDNDGAATDGRVRGSLSAVQSCLPDTGGLWISESALWRALDLRGGREGASRWGEPEPAEISSPTAALFRGWPPWLSSDTSRIETSSLSCPGPRFRPSSAERERGATPGDGLLAYAICDSGCEFEVSLKDDFFGNDSYLDLL